jgi:hypothetical protein
MDNFFVVFGSVLSDNAFEYAEQSCANKARVIGAYQDSNNQTIFQLSGDGNAFEMLCGRFYGEARVTYDAPYGWN